MLATYSDLQSAISDWLPDLTGSNRITDFISLAEQKLNRELASQGLSPMEGRSVTTQSTAYLALPSDFLRMRTLYISGNPNYVLEPVTKDYLMSTYNGSLTGRPRVYALTGSQLQLGPEPDTSYTFHIDYFGAFPSLSSTNTSNWLTDNAMDLLLYCALLQATPYLMADNRVQLWQAAYQDALQSVILADRDRAGSFMMTRPA